jgi:putative oxidoreductase
MFGEPFTWDFVIRSRVSGDAKMILQNTGATIATDIGLLFLRVCSSVLVLIVHGLPKIGHYRRELAAIEDPFHFGKKLTIAFAILAEVICPVLMILGIATRVCALPIMVVSAIALLRVHPEWSMDQGQFAWMLLILFGTIAIAGPGRYALGVLFGL